MEDSPRPEVRALLEGRALRVGLGCGEDRGVGPTLVSYLRGAGAEAIGTVVEATPVVAVVAGAAAATTVVSRLGLDPPAGGGEEWHTHNLKCALCVS